MQPVQTRQLLELTKSLTVPVVDVVSGQDNISDLWCNNCKQLYNSSDGALSADLLRTLEMEISSEDIANLSFSSEIIKQAVDKLKRGKSDGGSLFLVD